ncbi:MAG: hypothetical protein K1X51_03655 [Rhodospirillaceae bacterium]|nr:hypothetical protein [Rhodospirillaceae bacterium]
MFMLTKTRLAKIKLATARLPRVVGTVLLCAATVAPAAAQVARPQDRPGTSQMCIMSNYIEDTPVIDNRTILVRMNPGRGYKRIDLATDCSTMADGRALAFDTSVNRLCVQDTLNAQEDSGHACTISKIVTIDADEAQELMSRRR